MKKPNKTKVSTKKIADILLISTRHVRRLRAAADPRVGEAEERWREQSKNPQSTKAVEELHLNEADIDAMTAWAAARWPTQRRKKHP